MTKLLKLKLHVTVREEDIPFEHAIGLCDTDGNEMLSDRPWICLNKDAILDKFLGNEEYIRSIYEQYVPEEERATRPFNMSTIQNIFLTEGYPAAEFIEHVKYICNWEATIATNATDEVSTPIELNLRLHFDTMFIQGPCEL